MSTTQHPVATALSESPELIAEQAELETVLSSASFQRALGVSQVLRYLCEMYFQDRSSEVKEYTIAVEALGRREDFDPQTDAIVRVDLHHLRRKLLRYYAEEGNDHEIHIVLSTGSYMPEFVRQCCTLPDPLFRDTAFSDPSALEEFSPTLLHEKFSDAENLNGKAEPALSEIPKKNSAGDPFLLPSQSWPSTWPKAVLTFWLYARQMGKIILLLPLIVAGMLMGWRILPRLLPLHKYPSPSLLSHSLPLPTLIPVNASIIQGWQPPERMATVGEGAVRILSGLRSGNYLDAAGRKWMPDQFFSGGRTFQRPVKAIARSTEPELYSSGREGIFQYDIPVPPGEYEVHLFFAETQPGILDGMREVSYTVAGATGDHAEAATTHAYTIDVVTDAGGPYTATEKIYTHLHPSADGKIHLSFWSQDAFLNALEVLPEPQGKPRRLLLSTLDYLYVDTQGNRWLPDQYFLGGRSTGHLFSPSLRLKDESPIFIQERYGNFSYSLPVAQDATYTLTLWMAERYWGAANSGLGGAGSRVFHVFCNGIPLLYNFDILQASPSTSVATVIFHHLHPDAQGKLNLEFVPVRNYPLINAIEVQTE